MKTKRFLPYVRRARGGEKSESYRVAIRLAFHSMRKRPFYVLVQHGFPNLVLECATSRRELERSPLLVAAGRKTFRQWARDTQRYAIGKKAQESAAP